MCYIEEMVDIDFEFQKLVLFLQELNPAAIPLEDGLKSMIRFFDRLLVAFEIASDARKKELGVLMGDMAQKINTATKQLFEATGLKDEEILALVEKPDAFNEEEWRLVQEARGQVADYAKKISALMITLPTQAKTHPKGDKHEKKKPHQPPRKSWMKS